MNAALAALALALALVSSAPAAPTSATWQLRTTGSEHDPECMSTTIAGTVTDAQVGDSLAPRVDVWHWTGHHMGYRLTGQREDLGPGGFDLNIYYNHSYADKWTVALATADGEPLSLPFTVSTDGCGGRVNTHYVNIYQTGHDQ